MYPTTYGNIIEQPEKKVLFNGSTTLPIGAAVCYDRTLTDADQRNRYVVKPTFANLNDIAGVVVAVHAGPSQTGPFEASIVPVDGIMRGIQVLTDENVAVGDLLGPIPGSFYWGKNVTGQTCFRVTEAVDGSGTSAALVKGDLGFAAASQVDRDNRIIDFFDHFDGRFVAVAAVASAAAENTPYLLTGTSSTTTFSDSLNAEKSTAATRAAGVLSLTSNSTNEANLTLNGEPFGLAAGQALFFEARVTMAAVSAGTGIVGVGITDTAMATHFDFAGFKIVNGAISAIFQKGNSGEVAVSTGVTMTAESFNTLSILVRNRGSATGKKDVMLMVDGVVVAYTNNDTDRAEVPDTESLTLIANVVGSAAAQTLRIDRWRVRNYIQ